MNGRLVIGCGVAPPGAIYRLAVKVADHARAAGMRLLTLRTSRVTESDSCYLTLEDPGQRRWIVRVSNHRRPLRTKYPVPHFDLVSIDGTSGLDAACGAISAMIDGHFPWHHVATGPRGSRKETRR